MREFQQFIKHRQETIESLVDGVWRDVSRETEGPDSTASLQHVWNTVERLREESLSLGFAFAGVLSNWKTKSDMVQVLSTDNVAELLEAIHKFWVSFREPNCYSHRLCPSEATITVETAQKHGKIVGASQECLYLYRSLLSLHLCILLRPNERIYLEEYREIPALYELWGRVRGMSGRLSVATRMGLESVAEYLNGLVGKVAELVQLIHDSLERCGNVSAGTSLLSKVVAMNNKDMVQEFLDSFEIFWVQDGSLQDDGGNLALIKELIPLVEEQILTAVEPCFSRDWELGPVGALVVLCEGRSIKAETRQEEEGAWVLVSAAAEEKEEEDEAAWILVSAAAEEDDFESSLRRLMASSAFLAKNRRRMRQMVCPADQIQEFVLDAAAKIVRQSSSAWLSEKIDLASVLDSKFRAALIQAQVLVIGLVRESGVPPGGAPRNEWWLARRAPLREEVISVYREMDAELTLYESPLDFDLALQSACTAIGGSRQFVQQMNELLLAIKDFAVSKTFVYQHPCTPGLTERVAEVNRRVSAIRAAACRWAEKGGADLLPGDEFALRCLLKSTEAALRSLAYQIPQKGASEGDGCVIS